MIRESPKLSGELSLKSDGITKTKQGKKELIAILDRWKALKVLHAVNGNDFDFKVELVSKELNHLAAILHVYAGGLNFMK